MALVTVVHRKGATESSCLRDSSRKPCLCICCCCLCHCCCSCCPWRCCRLRCLCRLCSCSQLGSSLSCRSLLLVAGAYHCRRKPCRPSSVCQWPVSWRCSCVVHLNSVCCWLSCCTHSWRGCCGRSIIRWHSSCCLKHSSQLGCLGLCCCHSCCVSVWQLAAGQACNGRKQGQHALQATAWEAGGVSHTQAQTQPHGAGRQGVRGPKIGEHGPSQAGQKRH